MLDFALSTLAFFAAAFWIRRYLDEQGINRGMTRNTLVFVLATVVSLLVSAVVDKFEDKPAGGQHGDVAQVLKALAQ
ncbi:hypothetical protein CAP31_10950 [Sulfuriferula sp. AH1]|uniref:hypothetical protein n=1 Tax=Sulfuriferula sp. AH1 TaxID=1985873 RepID=UPI000B3B39D2|nr:hypothetical protein [Sulfuriferula sp. AH1]ARU32151.1 hypothetical protein CAP31_10950 [Sulfuriferula sp. AH1]